MRRFEMLVIADESDFEVTDATIIIGTTDLGYYDRLSELSFIDPMSEPPEPPLVRVPMANVFRKFRPKLGRAPYGLPTQGEIVDVVLDDGRAETLPPG